MDEHFLAVAKATGAEWGEYDFYLGILDRAPFLLRQTASEPPGCYFKFRKKGKARRPAPIARPAQIARPNPISRPSTVVHEIDDNEYVFLRISKPQLLTLEDIATLARECVREHA